MNSSKGDIISVDILCGLNWGDEAKGKITGYLLTRNHYDYVCRWAGGNNAGHTIYVNGEKYKTHLIPCGIFYDVKCVIGPDCVINMEGFQQELDYLEHHGFDISLIKVSPKAHVVMDKHIEEDIMKYSYSQGSTGRGIAPCYKDKYARLGTRAGDVEFFAPYLWDEKLSGNILCEGAQGFWLDINYGNYPYVTSSTTLPYGACVLGFPIQKINRIIGATKIYDTRSGVDPLFPESLHDDETLAMIGKVGAEIGVTTGRGRKTNWLNLDKLIVACCVTGVSFVIVSKVDVLISVGVFKLFYQDALVEFGNIELMKDFIVDKLLERCEYVKTVSFSGSLEGS